METQLNWFERNLYPLTKDYKDYIKYNFDLEKNQIEAHNELQRKLLEVFDQKLKNQRQENNVFFIKTLNEKKQIIRLNSFNNASSVVKAIKELDFSSKNTFVLREPKTLAEITIDSPKIQNKILTGLGEYSGEKPFQETASKQDIYNLNTNQKSNIMEKEFNQVQYLKDQLKYLGFGESEKLHKDLETGIYSPEKSFEIKTSSDKTLPDNKVDFTIKFSKSEQGGVFLNSYDATLSNAKHEDISQNFKVSRDNTFTAKEAVNLLEGRSVKIEFDNPKTNQREQAFVKLDLGEEKNAYGNYNFQTFHQNYGVNVAQIVEKTNLIFDKPEYKDNTIKSLEKGNVVNVKFELEDKIVEGKAALNAQYKNLNLYDSEMNRLNTNKPLQGLDHDNKHEKANVREQSISRGH